MDSGRRRRRSDSHNNDDSRSRRTSNRVDRDCDGYGFALCAEGCGFRDGVVAGSTQDTRTRQYGGNGFSFSTSDRSMRGACVSTNDICGDPGEWEQWPAPDTPATDNTCPLNGEVRAVWAGS